MAQAGSANVSVSWTWEETNEWTWDMILRLMSACLGVLGNLVVIIVLFPRRSVSRSTDILIGYLAGADFLTSLFLLPFPKALTVPSNWAGKIYCWTLFAGVHFFTWVIVSIYTLVFICLDRYIAVVYPLKHNIHVTRGRLHLTVLIIWLCAFANSAVTVYVTTDQVTNNRCSIRVHSELFWACYGFIRITVFYIIPLMIMLITQILAARTLLQQSHRWSNKGRPQLTPTFHLAGRRKVLRMMSIIVAVFTVSLGPNQLIYICFLLGLLPEADFQDTIQHFSQVLASINSSANPFIYALQNRRFRQGIIDMWTCSRSGNNAIFDLI